MDSFCPHVRHGISTHGVNTGMHTWGRCRVLYLGTLAICPSQHPLKNIQALRDSTKQTFSFSMPMTHFLFLLFCSPTCSFSGGYPHGDVLILGNLMIPEDKGLLVFMDLVLGGWGVCSWSFATWDPSIMSDQDIVLSLLCYPNKGPFLNKVLPASTPMGRHF